MNLQLLLLDTTFKRDAVVVFLDEMSMLTAIPRFHGAHLIILLLQRDVPAFAAFLAFPASFAAFAVLADLTSAGVDRRRVRVALVAWPVGCPMCDGCEKSAGEY